MKFPDNITIISGGQTGVDRAALDFALTNHIAAGGWCPAGRRAGDGVIPPMYPLLETPTSDYRQRTLKNILDSDGTLIIYKHKLDTGTALTLSLCKKIRKPHLVIKLADPADSYQLKLSKWLTDSAIFVLNVAGPRESSEPGIYDEALAFLKRELLT
ncbi:MAG: putative molybdenum carrier protein [Bacteroidales bacterium]|nr:putative molybdenum carrier protein [Bacteroidales bacterium]